MTTVTKVIFNIPFSIKDVDGLRTIFSREAIKDMFAQMENLPIKMSDEKGNVFQVGHIERRECINDYAASNINILRCKGELYCAPKFVVKNDEIKYLTIDLLPKPTSENLELTTKNEDNKEGGGRKHERTTNKDL